MIKAKKKHDLQFTCSLKQGTSQIKKLNQSCTAGLSEPSWTRRLKLNTKQHGIFENEWKLITTLN